MFLNVSPENKKAAPVHVGSLVYLPAYFETFFSIPGRIPFLNIT